MFFSESRLVKTDSSDYDQLGRLVARHAYGDEGTVLTTAYGYDAHGRQAATRGPDGTLRVQAYDNWDRPYISAAFHSWAALDMSALPVLPATEPLSAYAHSQHNALASTTYGTVGTAYRETAYAANNTGGFAAARSTRYWYNRVGWLVKSRSADGLFSKTTYTSTG